MHELFFTLFALIVLGVQIVILAFGMGLFGSTPLTAGAVVALVMLVERVYTPVAIFNVNYVNYKLDKVAYDRLRDFMESPDDNNLLGGELYRHTDGALSFENVGFRYEDTPVLENLSLRARPGIVTALVGVSGAGKSTAVGLLLGLLKPTQGRVLASGQSLSTLNLDGYYSNLAYVPQDAPVFDGTLRDNLMAAGSDDARLLDAINRAQLRERYDTMPDGLDTELGERGVRLSGGERQRLALARILLSTPPLVILDEPTSAMDAITEQRVMDEVLRALRGSTVILIAHRMRTVRLADHIIVLEAGRLTQEGTHDELMATGGLYADLVRRQQREGDDGEY